MIFGEKETHNNIPFETFRMGVVSSIDRKNATARVYFEDREDAVSYDLKIVVPQTMKTKYYSMPDIGETVICGFLASGQETGFIFGSVYSEVDKTPAPIWKKEYDRRGLWIDGKNFIEWVEDKREFLVRSEKPIRFEVDPDWPEWEDDYNKGDWSIPYEPNEE